MKPYRYAQATKVPANQTRNEIETMLTKKHGATGFVYGSSSEMAMVAFEMHGWRIRFTLPLPTAKRGVSDKQLAAETRRRWRALGLVIKAKLEAVQSGIVAFEREFLAHIVVRGNETVGDQIIPGLAATLAQGELPKLLGSG